MVDNSNHDYTIFDTIIDGNGIFAVYRIPGSTVINFMAQESGEPTCFSEINSIFGTEGFVVSPFSTEKGRSIVIFRNDVILEGIDNIFNYLNNCNQLCEKSARHVNEYESVRESDDFSRYEQAFKTMHSSLLNGMCDKVVLSRKVNIFKPIGFSTGNSFYSALNAYPDAFVCLFSSPLTGTWLVISPEMILSGNGDEWQTVSLAGTKFRSEDLTEISWDAKNMGEQEIVSDYIEHQLIFRNLNYIKKGPYTAAAGKILHLKTDYFFRLNDNLNPAEMLELLHPTPAVCGFPRENALKLIQNSEGYDRSFYSGFCGPYMTQGNTCLYVNLRCMEITTESLDLYSGGGLMPSSQLKNEWEETEAKLQTMLSVINH